MALILWNVSCEEKVGFQSNGGYTLMKKALTLLFTFAVAAALALPAFAQDTGAAGQESTGKMEKKSKKTKKAKKSKKAKNAEGEGAAPQQ